MIIRLIEYSNWKFYPNTIPLILQITKDYTGITGQAYKITAMLQIDWLIDSKAAKGWYNSGVNQ